MFGLQWRAHENGFCVLHLKAYLNVIGKLCMAEPRVCFGVVFLVQIQKNSLTGEWAKEVENT
jgi:hypothetical protein